MTVRRGCRQPHCVKLSSRVRSGGAATLKLTPVPFLVRPARPLDFEAAERIENAADVLLTDRLSPISWPPAPPASERASAPGFTLVAVTDEQPVGFTQVLEVDGLAHLEQLSVLPEHGRRGIGRALVEAATEEARARGYREITLRTFADVPWNAPFYESCGFAESEPETEFHRGLEGHEPGLAQLGRRIQMTRRLTD